jgi:hypothetical protein
MGTETMLSVFEEDQRGRDHETEERERTEKWRKQDELFERLRETTQYFTASGQRLIAAPEAASLNGASVATAAYTTAPPTTGLVKRAPRRSLNTFKDLRRKIKALRDP